MLLTIYTIVFGNLFLRLLYIAAHTIAMANLIIAVPGIYAGYPDKRSANAEPSPAAIAPYGLPKSQAERSTAASPMFTYPFVPKVGTFITIVARVVIAANVDAVTMFLSFSFILISILSSV